MPTTASRKYPYPTIGEGPDGPTAFQNLAEKVDADVTKLFEDTGWINIVPTDGRFSIGSAGAAYRRRSGHVHIQAHLVMNPTNARGTFFTLPEGFRPTRTFWVIMGSSGTPQAEMRIEPTGALVLVGTPGNNSNMVGYISFPVD